MLPVEEVRITEADIEMAQAIAREVQSRGGTAYYVGGFVRDRQMGLENKDVDIEVHGITPAVLGEILDGLGERISMGASFGVWGLKNHHLDIAMPRMEKATGRGHRDFEVFVDPFLGVEKAARRRDFTVNALMEAVLTGEVVDPFGGLGDLKSGILRHVCAETFPEDPLRVLRAAQFAARYSFSVAPETVKLCAAMELSSLPPERIFGELKKALLKAAAPSVFFGVLGEMGQLGDWFPELEALPDSAAAVLNRAAAIRGEAEKPLYFMMSALCLAADKPEQMLDRLTQEKALKDYVQNMLGLVGRLENPGENRNFLFDWSVNPSDLLLLFRAAAGEEKQDTCVGMQEQLAEYRALLQKPQVIGRDLMAAGLRPGKHFSALLAYAHRLHLMGVAKPEALQKTLERTRNSKN